jgi:hypothetical protein
MHIAAAAALALVVATPMAAQDPDRNARMAVTSMDIQRLQDQVYDTGNDIARLRSRDQATADRLQTRLDDVRDEVVYLRVKMRRDGSVGRDEYSDVRARLESLRAEMNAGDYESGAPTRPELRQGQAPPRSEIPWGTQLDVRLDRALTSETAQVEDRFTATTVADLYQGNGVMIPAGSTLRGVVSSVTKATRTDRKGSMTLAFDQISINGRTYPIYATVSQAFESEGLKDETAKIGAGAGIGAIIGGILGGAKGALVGILVGGGGILAATDGSDVTLPSGTIIRVRMERPLLIQ